MSIGDREAPGGVPPGLLGPAWRAQLEDPELAAEFDRLPLGPHSDRLRRLLLVMRSAPVAGKPVVVEDEDGRRVMATVPARYGDPLVPHGVVTGLGDDDLERRAFALRWRAMFGTELPA